MAPGGRATAKRYVINPTPDGDIDWEFFFQDWLDNPVKEMIGKGRINDLSPAEKYDLLVGDENLTLTKMMWNEGRTYFQSTGKVERWMGICHGWAAAAFMHERPANPVQVKGYKGEDLLFYPSDIKALTSLLWAKNDYQSRFVGGRCNTKGLRETLKTGRELTIQIVETITQRLGISRLLIKSRCQEKFCDGCNV